MVNRPIFRHIWIAAALLASCGSTSAEIRINGPHYNATVVRHAPFEKSQTDALVKDIIKSAKDLNIEIKMGERHRKLPVVPKHLGNEPLHILGALRLALNSSTTGAEMDLMVRIKGKNPTPVQVLWNGNTLLLEAGRSTIFAAKRRETLGLRFVNGSGNWTNLERTHVEKAANLLEKDLLRLIAEIPLKREKTRRVTSIAKGGLYEQKGCSAQIRMYSTAFAGRHLRFIGSPSRPLSKTTATILHEIAHAIHHTPSRRAYCRLDQRSAKFEKERRAFNAALKRQNSRADVQRLQAKESWLNKERLALERILGEANSLSQKGPILADYERQLKDRKGPTHYGASNIAESFAESFALYYGDRSALQRIWPDIVKWFDNRGHIPKK